MMIRRSFMQFCRTCRLGSLQTAYFSEHQFESHLDGEMEAPQKKIFAPRVITPFKASQYQILMNPDRDEMLKEFMKEGSSENFNEIITNTINSLDQREGVDFWRTVSEEDKKIIIDNLMEIKKEHFGFTNRSINFDFINSVIKACLKTHSYQVVWYTLQRMFENNKSKTAKLGLIQQFYTVAAHAMVKKSDPQMKEIVKCMDEEYNSILSTNVPFDFKFMNLCVRSVIANLEFCLSGSPSSSKNVSDLCTFILENKLDNVNFLPLLKFCSLALEMSSRKQLSVRIKSEYNVDYINMIISQFESIANEQANLHSQGSNSYEAKPFPRVTYDRVLSSDVLNIFIQGMLIKHVDYWKPKPFPLLQYAHCSRFVIHRKGFSQWLMNELQTSKPEEMDIKELILMIQITSQLSYRHQSKVYKLKLLKAIHKSLNSIKSNSVFLNIMQLCSSFPEVSKIKDESEDSKDKFKLPLAEVETVKSILNHCQESIDNSDNLKRFGSHEIKVLTEIYLRDLKLVTMEEFKEHQIYARFQDLVQKGGTLTSELNTVVSILEILDVKTDVKLLEQTLAMFQRWLEGCQRSYSLVNVNEKKRIRKLYEKISEGASEVEPESKRLIEEIGNVLVSIENAKFEKIGN